MPSALVQDHARRRPVGRRRGEGPAWPGSASIGSWVSSTSPALPSRCAELVETSSRLTVDALAELQHVEPRPQLVDVRNATETAEGALPQAREIPLPTLAERAGPGLDRLAPVVGDRESGYRSQVAAKRLSRKASRMSRISSAATRHGTTPGAERRPTDDPTSRDVRAGDVATERYRHRQDDPSRDSPLDLSVLSVACRHASTSALTVGKRGRRRERSVADSTTCRSGSRASGAALGVEQLGDRASQVEHRRPFVDGGAVTKLLRCHVAPRTRQAVGVNRERARPVLVEIHELHLAGFLK